MLISMIWDESYLNDLNTYTEEVVARAGVSSRSAEREVIYMAEKGNLVCTKLYGDMIFYKKIHVPHAQTEAFNLYMAASGLTVMENGEWRQKGPAYPQAYWMVAYYLMNYKRESDLKDGETNPVLDALPLAKRFGMAAELTRACLAKSQVPGALNLMGRILKEASREQELYEAVNESLSFASPEEMKQASVAYYEAAADAGYAYACNNLAASEAERIVELSEAGKTEEIPAVVDRYLRWLKSSADRFEPYAANRLGLFYRTGEVRGTNGTVHLREYTNAELGREYFYKAVKYPEKSSAWAYFNLLKYYHQDYDNNIDLMNEHMERIKELNPEVYDIAIEL